jgi:hypothetical protein
VRRQDTTNISFNPMPSKIMAAAGIFDAVALIYRKLL